MTAMDVTDSDFHTAVIDRSYEVPVVVDFWAEWCGPCRQLGPVIEKAVAARAGKIELAKVDVDGSPGISRSFGIQSIPAVKAFRDGQVAAEFVGVQPPLMVERFLDGLVPSEADGLIEAGDEASLRRAVELEPTRAEAIVPLARMLHERGELDQALELLQRTPGSFAADGLAARIGIERAGQPDLAAAWSALDALRGRPVRVLIGERSVVGLARGVERDGEFCVDVDARLQKFSSGEVSLRLEGQ